nr:FecR domain-containing protein [uncultured Draconibacterium sp.]
MTRELLEKYLNNSCTSDEVDVVINWMKQQSFLSESEQLGQDNWQQFKNEYSNVSDEKLDILLDKIHHKINIEEPRTIRLKNTKLFSWVSKIAAIFFIPILAFLFYTMTENGRLSNQLTAVAVDSLEVIAPVGSRTVVELSDGSVVHLNYGSQIKYPQNFLGETRSVTLIGEGYFEVAHNPDKPFVVKTNDMNIKALGTSFNVLAYSDADRVETTLVNGKVVLEQEKSDGSIKRFGTMIPGQHVAYHKVTGTISSSKGSVDKYIAWTDGKLVFENEPIQNIAQRLSRMFNVEIKVDKKVEQYKYTVTFIDEPLFQILELLSVATPIRYKALPRERKSDGTFSKQIILIEGKE